MLTRLRFGGVGHSRCAGEPNTVHRWCVPSVYWELELTVWVIWRPWWMEVRCRPDVREWSGRSCCACGSSVGAISQSSSGLWWGASSCAVKSGTWCWCDVPSVFSFRLLDLLCPIGDTLYAMAVTYGCIRDVRSTVWCSSCNRPVVDGWSTLSVGVASWDLVSDCLLCQPWMGICCIISTTVMGKLFKEGAKGKEKNFRRANIIY